MNAPPPENEKGPPASGAIFKTTNEKLRRTHDDAPRVRSQARRPGISTEVLDAGGVRHVDAIEAKRLVGYDAAGVVIPYYELDGSPMLTPDGDPFARLRIDVPTTSAKYLSPRGSGARAYFPNGLRKLLVPGCTLGITEGEFKALALVEAGFAAVGIGGISSACKRNGDGEFELLTDLAGLLAVVRPGKIAFCGDSDTALIPDFSREAVKIAGLVSVPVVLPRIPLHGPKAPDDLREIHGDAFPELWRSILEQAEPVSRDTKQAALAVRLLRREADALERLTGDELDKARERLVKLAAAFKGDALSSASIEEFAAGHAGIPRTTLRAAVGQLVDERRPAQPPAKLADESIMILPSSDLPITDSATAIFARIAETKTLFYRGGRIVGIGTDSDGAHRLEPIDSSQFRSRLESYGKIYVHRSMPDNTRVLKPALCPDEIAKALLVSLPARELLPAVNRLAGCPVLVNDDGTMRVLGPGWHPSCGGIYITGGENPPRVPLAEAVETLVGLVRDFDFPTEGDRSRALASFIAPALRFGGWLTGHLPIDLGEADASQSGKTYRQKCVAAVYRETPNTVVQKTGGVGGLDESIGQKLVDGRPFVLFDNLRGRFDSAYLEAVLTAPGSMPARVPHRGEIQVDARGFIFMLTSNGVETTRDLANRGSIIRIRKRPAGYAFAQFPEGDIHQHIVANQPRFLGSVFAVVAEWVTRGQPHTREHRHDFREWAQSLDWICQNILKAAPLLDGHEDARARVCDPRRNWLRSLCIALRDAGRTGEFYASQLAEFAVEGEIPPPNVRPDADEPSVARAIGKVMAAAFGGSDSIEIDGFVVSRSKRYSPTAELQVWAYSIADQQKAA